MLEKILCAMSGGVDSSVAAFLLAQEGYDVVGGMMKLYNGDEELEGSLKSCCTAESAGDAASVCAELDIPFYVFNLTQQFDECVIKPFTQFYQSGKTPNPCLNCNKYLKFQYLFDKALSLGCGKIATGHYARIERQGERYFLKRALDRTKDQSYALYMLTQNQLAHTLFPLGNYSKEQIREIAKENKIITYDKQESQDICFVPNGKYAEFLEANGLNPVAGNFIDENGKVLGSHSGTHNFTIGQRKGLGVSAEHPLFVKRIDSTNGAVTLCQGEKLYTKRLSCKEINFTATNALTTPLKATAAVRYRGKEEQCVVHQTSEDTMVVEFENPIRAITPGQACVIYDGDVVVGGGVIERAETVL